MARKANPAKDHYQRLRVLSCEELWNGEVAEFDRADVQERMRRVAVVRAVGVVFSESGSGEQKERARRWLRGLLEDPEEKIRRYAMTALPKIGADETEEAALHSMLRRAASEREIKHLGRALEKIGGAATLGITAAGGFAALEQTEQKVEANLARTQTPSAVLLDRILPNAAEMRIRLRCRSGLERIVEEELRESLRSGAKFRRIGSERGVVTIAPAGSFSLADVYAMRCFSTAAIVLGQIRASGGDAEAGALAAVIASPRAWRVFEAFTEGPIRYRLEFVSKGHQRSMVRKVAARVYELSPRLLNDSREALWQVEIRHAADFVFVELVPRLRPDPRFDYRRQDVPAASHPPLAASMARLAGKLKNEIVWDPFCGSGLELIETALRGGVRRVIGTDLSPEAIEIARSNFAAALADAVSADFECCDFRDWKAMAAMEGRAVSLIITNPPLGRRVPIPNLRGLIGDLFAAGDAALKPGGRLVFVNPLAVKPEARALRLEFRQKVDLGGFNCHLEKYVKA